MKYIFEIEFDHSVFLHQLIIACHYTTPDLISQHSVISENDNIKPNNNETQIFEICNINFKSTKVASQYLMSLIEDHEFFHLSV